MEPADDSRAGSEMKRIVFGWILDFLCWSGWNDFTETQNINAVFRTQLLLEECLHSQVLLSNVSYRRRQVKLIRFLINLLKGEDIKIGSQFNKTILEVAICEFEDLKADFSEYASEVEAFDVDLKAYAVLVCCLAENFDLAENVYERLNLKALLESTLLSKKKKAFLNNVRKVVVEKSRDHQFLKTVDYKSFSMQLLPWLTKLFHTIPEPSLIEMYRNMMLNGARFNGDSETDGGMKVTDTSNVKIEDNDNNVMPTETKRVTDTVNRIVSPNLLDSETSPHENGKMEVDTALTEDVVMADANDVNTERLKAAEKTAKKTKKVQSPLSEECKRRVMDAFDYLNQKGTLAPEVQKEMPNLSGDYDVMEVVQKARMHLSKLGVLELLENLNAQKQPERKLDSSDANLQSPAMQRCCVMCVPLENDNNVPRSVRESVRSSGSSPSSVRESVRLSGSPPISKPLRKPMFHVSAQNLLDFTADDEMSVVEPSNSSSLNDSISVPKLNLQSRDSPGLPTKRSHAAACEKSTSRKQSTSRKRVKKLMWSTTEERSLYAGVKMYGLGKWSMIRGDPSFNFAKRQHYDLSDKWRNLSKNKLKMKQLERQWLSSNKKMPSPRKTRTYSPLF